ncbi:MAG: hypothetical protein Q8L54_11785 [Devosia sp.]|nr:hypothetical protein [Devosia sp.]
MQQPGLQLFHDANMYNAVVSAHGLAIIFFVLMSALIGGLGNWFVPILISLLVGSPAGSNGHSGCGDNCRRFRLSRHGA